MRRSVRFTAKKDLPISPGKNISPNVTTKEKEKEMEQKSSSDTSTDENTFIDIGFGHVPNQQQLQTPTNNQNQNQIQMANTNSILTNDGQNNSILTNDSEPILTNDGQDTNIILMNDDKDEIMEDNNDESLTMTTFIKIFGGRSDEGKFITRLQKGEPSSKIFLMDLKRRITLGGCDEITANAIIEDSMKGTKFDESDINVICRYLIDWKKKSDFVEKKTNNQFNVMETKHKDNQSDMIITSFLSHLKKKSKRCNKSGFGKENKRIRIPKIPRL